MPALRDLRYKLQQRRDNVLRSEFQRFCSNLTYFMNFIESNFLIKSIVDELEAYSKDIMPASEWVDKLKNERSAPIYDDETLNACFCHSMIRYTIDIGTGKLDKLFWHILSKKDRSDQLDAFNEEYVNPFYQYIDERIDDFNSTLYLLQKYKYACEWFERDRLFNQYKGDESRGEANLDRDLRKFLFLQGIDYPFSSPLSASGRVDVIAELDTDNPLVLEIKIFDLDKGYDKAYIRKGFRQAYDYANDYNEPIGYLFVFKTCERDLVFNLTENGMPRKVIFGDKTIFIIQADIFVHSKSSSERKKLDPYVIDEDYLISSE
jgi:hypothetical protein